MKMLLMIFLGGGVGSVLRFLVSKWIQTGTDSSFPFGTLAVNVLGCLVIGFLARLLTSGPVVVSEELRFALLIGLLGGFTTFSTFGYDTMTMLEEGQFGRATAYVLLSNGLGLACVFIGVRAAVRVAGG
ncbi:MAG: fluoride efflux transporter CrcB [Phycisphaerales bacterium]